MAAPRVPPKPAAYDHRPAHSQDDTPMDRAPRLPPHTRMDDLFSELDRTMESLDFSSSSSPVEQPRSDTPSSSFLVPNLPSSLSVSTLDPNDSARSSISSGIISLYAEKGIHSRSTSAVDDAGGLRRLSNLHRGAPRLVDDPSWPRSSDSSSSQPDLLASGPSSDHSARPMRRASRPLPSLPNVPSPDHRSSVFDAQALLLTPAFSSAVADDAPMKMPEPRPYRPTDDVEFIQSPPDPSHSSSTYPSPPYELSGRYRESSYQEGGGGGGGGDDYFQSAPATPTVAQHVTSLSQATTPLAYPGPPWSPPLSVSSAPDTYGGIPAPASQEPRRPYHGSAMNGRTGISSAPNDSPSNSAGATDPYAKPGIHRAASAANGLDMDRRGFRTEVRPAHVSAASTSSALSFYPSMSNLQARSSADAYARPGATASGFASELGDHHRQRASSDVRSASHSVSASFVVPPLPSKDERDETLRRLQFGGPGNFKRGNSSAGQSSHGSGASSTPASPPPVITTSLIAQQQESFPRDNGVGGVRAEDGLGPMRSTSYRLTPLATRHGNRASLGVSLSENLEFVHFALLSNVAMLLKDHVPRGAQIKGSISYPDSFTGKDVVSTVQALLPPLFHRDRRTALQVARSLQSQLFFHEVDWGHGTLKDGVEEVYQFLEDSVRSLVGAASQQDPFSDVYESEGGVEEAQRRKGRSAKRKTLILEQEELPTGVFVALTECYSPTCGKDEQVGACYSHQCPHKTPLRRHRSVGSVSSGLSGLSGQDSTVQKAWAELVPPEVIKSLPPKEVERQNAIHETVQKEEQLLADLELYETLFIGGLQTQQPPPIPHSRLPQFIEEVFYNYKDLTFHIRRLVERMHVRQREENPVVQTFGDLILDAALQWGDAYTDNMGHYPIAVAKIKQEMADNPKFREFVEACRKDPAAHRHSAADFLFRPSARLPRYRLHLESILKKTADANADVESCKQALEIINDQCKLAQVGVEEAEHKVRLMDLHRTIIQRPGKPKVDFDLLNPARQLVHEDYVSRRPDTLELDWTDLYAILFDNFLVLTKPKKGEGSGSPTRYHIVKRPVPIELLECSGFSLPPMTKSIGLHFRSGQDRAVFPFTVTHVGRPNEPLTMFAPSQKARDRWKAKLGEARQLRATVQEANKSFDFATVSETHFRSVAYGADGMAMSHGGDFHGRVTCAVPFTIADGRRLIAIGCEDGVWIGLRHDPRTFRKVLHVKLVTQLAVLERFGMFVVLGGRVLLAYALEALVPSAGAAEMDPSARTPQRLSGQKDVLLFRVGTVKDRTLLVYMKRKANESVFRALEPVARTGDSTERGGHGWLRFGGSNKTEWFRKYKDFFIPSETYSIQFMKSKLCIICGRGFEIMNLDTLIPGTIPDFVHSAKDDPRVIAIAKRIETAKPLGQFKSADNDFILCYDSFACYVDRLGEFIKLDQVIEWEGSPQSVAYSHPYVFAFDAHFVEIRHASTGVLVQVVRGNDIRFLSEGHFTGDSGDEPAIIAVKRQRTQTTTATGAHVSEDFQQVFELVPTVAPTARPAVSPGHVSTPSRQFF